jgi:hypothetical protein
MKTLSPYMFIILPWKPAEMPVCESSRRGSIREEFARSRLPVTESGSRLTFPTEKTVVVGKYRQLTPDGTRFCVGDGRRRPLA